MSMTPVVSEAEDQIKAICAKHQVKRLDLFGSAARGDFEPSRSDIDFLVEFVDYASPTLADQWFGLQEDLQTLLGAPVELVSLRTATNPYFLEVVNRHRVPLYAA